MEFAGSIPEHYDAILGPAQFEAIATDLVRRIPVRPKGDVLELACGTGIVTRRLRERVDPAFRIVATDLSEDMLAYARSKVKGRIDWRPADAAALPFRDASFGAVVCGLGVMFVPDKKKLCSDVRRVLAEGGALYFNVWDSLERNAHGQAAAEVFEELFPGDAEMQWTRVPFGYHDRDEIRRQLDASRFAGVRIEPVTIRIQAPSARAYATGQLRGTPRGTLIEKKGLRIDDVIGRVAAALAKIGGDEPFSVDGHLLVVQATAV